MRQENDDRVPSNVAIRIFGQDMTVDAYLNAQLVKSLATRDRLAGVSAADVPLPQESQGVLRKGRNVLAVHCSKGKFVDVGLVELEGDETK